MLGQLIAQQSNIVFFLTDIQGETDMSQNNRDNMGYAQRALTDAAEHLQSASDYAGAGGDAALVKRIATIKEGVQKEATSIGEKLGTKQG